MRRLLLLVAVFAFAAFASELRVGIVQGANIRTFTGSAGGHYSLQCLSVDGGTDQTVYYRPGCRTRTDAGISCVIDAGQGDTVVNFNSATGGSSDPYKIDLATNEDRFHLATTSSYATPLYCTVGRRSP